MAVKEVWQKYFGGPRHLVTIAQAIGDKKQITINMYFQEAEELFDLVPVASAVLTNQESDFKKEVAKVQADIAKQRAAALKKETK